MGRERWGGGQWEGGDGRGQWERGDGEGGKGKGRRRGKRRVDLTDVYDEIPSGPDLPGWDEV